MIKIQQLVKATIVATAILFPSVGFALEARPDSRGDYYSWAANWIVATQSGNLNCRSGPATNYRIVTKFSRASYLATFSELEGDPIRRDRQGLPWVRVKWANARDTLPCYVRANVSFIGAMDTFNNEQSACIERAIKKGRSFYDAAFNCVD